MGGMGGGMGGMGGGMGMFSIPADPIPETPVAPVTLDVKKKPAF